MEHRGRENRFQVSGFRIKGGFSVQCSDFRIEGSGSKV
jgi:hypothetical protein